VKCAAGQVKVDPAVFAEYAWSGRTAGYHRARIRAALGFRESTVAMRASWRDWLAAELCPAGLNRDRPRLALLARCRHERIEPPGPGRIERIPGTAAGQC
jgi:hypothetical protein